MKIHRNMKTTSERRKAAAPEHAHLVRAKRNAKNLPNTWDDVRRYPKRETRPNRLRSKNNFRNTIRTDLTS